MNVEEDLLNVNYDKTRRVVNDWMLPQSLRDPEQHRKEMAHNTLILPHCIAIKDPRTGHVKGRLHIKYSNPVDRSGNVQLPFARGNYDPALHIRATNGHLPPGIECPESLYERVTTGAGDGPKYFIHGTDWDNYRSILMFGLSCLGQHSGKKHHHGRQ